MNKKDIRPGVLYGYVHPGRLLASAEQIVFLASLDSTGLYRRNAEGALVKSGHAKPGTYASALYYGHGEPGWIAAIGDDVTGASLEQALSASLVQGSAYRYVLIGSGRGVRPWAEVTAAREEARIAQEEWEAAREAQFEARRKVVEATRAEQNEITSRMSLLKDKLEALGVTVSLRGFPPSGLEMTEEAARDLVQRLEVPDGS